MHLDLCLVPCLLLRKLPNNAFTKQKQTLAPTSSLPSLLFSCLLLFLFYLPLLSSILPFSLLPSLFSLLSSLFSLLSSRFSLLASLFWLLAYLFSLLFSMPFGAVSCHWMLLQVAWSATAC